VVPPPDNLRPTVAWVSPGAGAVYTAGDTLTLEANAADADGNIREVRYYADGQLLGTATTLPYRLDWMQPSPGQLTMEVVAMDNLGALSDPAAVTVNFQYPPEVYFSQPYDGDRFTAPATLDLVADARDADGEIAEVEFYVNGALLATAETFSSPNYYYRWHDAPVDQ